MTVRTGSGERSGAAGPTHAAVQGLGALDLSALVLVTFIWGSNFVVARVALGAFDPLLLATIRFLLVSLPLLPFVRKPPAPFGWLALNGLFSGVGQFGLLYLALRGHISPGLASLVMQTQVLVTIVLAPLILRDRVALNTWVGLAVATVGLLIVALHVDATFTPTGLAMTLAAATCWGCSNVLIQHRARRTAAGLPMLAIVVWSNLFALPPMIALTFASITFGTALDQLASAQAWPWIAAAWQAVGNTLVGFVFWNRLLARHPSALVAPWALLVPVFGIATAVVLTGEPMPPWKWGACALVLAGLAIASGAARRLAAWTDRRAHAIRERD